MEKPRHLGPAYAMQFQDESVVEAYMHRPYYPTAVFTRLIQLIQDAPRAILDVGCGRGELARPLAPSVDRLDAVDWSAAMVAHGQRLPGGANPHLQWQVGEVAEPFAMSAPAISQHLKMLERAGLIVRTANAQWRSLTMRTEPLDEASAWVEKHRREWNQRFDAREEHLKTMTTEEEQ